MKLYLILLYVCGQEFAKTMEPECIKADLIQLFHNLANDEQVSHKH